MLCGQGERRVSRVRWYVVSMTRQEWTLMALAERMRARITKTGSNVLPWKIVASTRSNGRQRGKEHVTSWRKNWQQRASLEVRGFLPWEKKNGSNILPWKVVASLLLNNFLNNSLEFPEKANSTIVSERWRQKHVTCNYLSSTKFTPEAPPQLSFRN